MIQPILDKYCGKCHQGAGKAKLDRAYLNMQRYLHQDKATFEARKAVGFVDDFEAVVHAP